MRIINENNEYRLVQPYNTWDTNYHLIDKETGTDYLIDRDDVTNVEGDYHSLISYNEMISLTDIETLKEIAWKRNEDTSKHLKGTNRIF